MPTREAELKSAFKRFVELIEPIEGVEHVVAIEPRRPDIFTYIKRMDEEVEKQVFRVEDSVSNEFPQMLIEFHIVFLDGRPFEYFWRTAPELTYSRQGAKKKEAKGGVKR